MKSFASALAVISVFLSSALATPIEATTEAAEAVSVSVSYDTVYDVGTQSIDTVSCSNLNYATFADIPGFPNIGGAPTVSGYGSPNCGQCYQLTYGTTSIYVTAIDAAPGGFNIAQAAMNSLTGGQAVQLGRVTATYTEVDSSLCA
ncbi:allergenic cerato-platanin Asp F13 [Aspergillus saccharolyticus JOP 1030-1]|uniref:Cerato-platanin-domain-containing protein n=1 Tax=Aspergillus saccharolyticus JOP 1030-1 TaxID=1450539 RepID=A0A318ZA84_9EURO|nr:Cerato-platanin-domain-containing protein [Aspergillus saccharolyticus JOP 1030-1]PYH44189.1 Cerato-platanin-domain-containing protein [Aspergillus saccharolyticus JOP 1030-1]